MSNVKIGNFLYSSQDLPFAGKVLNALNARKSGASMLAIAQLPEITSDFNGDGERAQAKVRVALSNLRMRGVVQEIVSGNGFTLFKISNKDDASLIMQHASNVSDKLSQATAEAATTTVVSAGSKSKQTSTAKVNKMAKTPRMFKNPETNSVQAFGAGRPSAVKLACECDKDGKYLDPQRAAAFLQNGGKADDKLTKAELLDLLKKVRAERDTAVANLEAVIEAMNAENGETVEETSVDAEGAEDGEDGEDGETADESDGLDLEAEAVESEEETEAEVG